MMGCGVDLEVAIFDCGENLQCGCHSDDAFAKAKAVNTQYSSRNVLVVPVW